MAAASAAMGKDINLSKKKRRKGQGIEGLYRGCRVGMWGLIGVWGAGWMGGMATGSIDAAGEAGGHAGKF